MLVAMLLSLLLLKEGRGLRKEEREVRYLYLHMRNVSTQIYFIMGKTCYIIRGHGILHNLR